MPNPTKIEYPDFTVNVASGCARVSAGCENCYACRIAATRLKHHPRYAGVAEMRNGRPEWTGKIILHEDKIKELAKLPDLRGKLRRDKPWLAKEAKAYCGTILKGLPTVCFVQDMGDLFHPAVPDRFIRDVFSACCHVEPARFLILTKRVDRVVDLSDALQDEHGLADNLWLGATVENGRCAETRLPLLEEIAAMGWHTWASYEPALGPVDFSGCEWLDWLVAGAETGPRARTASFDWFRSARDWAGNAGVPFFLKRIGPDGNRLLDGRQWNEVPWSRDEG